MKLNILNIALTSILLFSNNYVAAEKLRKGIVPSELNDTLNTLSGENKTGKSNLFNADNIIIKGFAKKLSDTKESFFITNNTDFNISRFKIQLRYTDTKDCMIHERTELIECNIPAKSTRQVYIIAFDKQRKFFYYSGTRPKRAATPFKVAFKLLRYDIIAE